MARVKKKDHERLTDENIRKVISLLNPEDGKAITKKEACSILNIAYNTTRLDKIISEFESKEEHVSKMKAANRGKPATKEEIASAIEAYLNGENYSNIAKRLYRSAAFIKNIVERVGVPQRPTRREQAKGYDIIPDPCIAEEFKPGEVVWSAKYHTTAIIKKEDTTIDYEAKYGSKCYLVEIVEDVNAGDSFFPFITKGGYCAFVLAYDLGRLSHLEEYGVNLSRI